MVGRFGRTMTTTVSDSLPEDTVLDQLWARCRDDKLTMVCRDADYMKWRYGQMPVKGYTYIQATQSDVPVFLLICRQTSVSLEIVDYVGELSSLSLLMAAIDSALPCAKGLQKVVCYVSSSRLSTALLLRGFLPGRHRSRLFVRGQNEMAELGSRVWFLTGGDSDSEVIRAKRGLESPGIV